MAKASQGEPQAEPDDVDRLLLDLASGLLADYFFDPVNESQYRELFPSRRTPARGTSRAATPTLTAPPLTKAMMQHDGQSLHWWLDILGQRNGFRLSMDHPSFSAKVEGIWQFQRETLRQGRVVQRSGDPKRVVTAVEGLLTTLGSSEPSQEVLEDLLAALSEPSEAPLIGDNPEAPPPATSAEREQLRTLISQLSRKARGEPAMEDRTWLETTPQTLPVLADLLVEAMTASPRQDRQAAVCLDLLTMQLEFVRYRLDRGWDWAAHMLNEYQQRLVALGRAGTLQSADWFAMGAALQQARVPVADEVQLALADAGLSGGTAVDAHPDELLGALRGLGDELASMVSSPFEVIESLRAAATVMPATLRSFMATELALSPHAVLREAVPLMLLDGDASVRRAAAAAMEQTAGLDTVSPDWLRRAITLRNWIPQADRADLDRAIRKARSAGVPIGAWPNSPGTGVKDAPGIVFHASMVDGSGAQSILGISRTGRKGLVAGLLLKHGVGVVDAWLDPAVARRASNGMLRDMQSEVPSDEVDRGYVDAVVQHAIATGLASGTVPGEIVLAIAESVSGAEWKDRRLDVAAQAERLFGGLDAADRRPDGVVAALDRGAVWMRQQPIAASWFEDTQKVRRVIAKLPRKDTAGATRLVLTEVLPDSRSAWAERFLLMAMWCQSAVASVHRDWATDFIILTHALVGDTPLEAIPIMTSIATQTVLAARTSGW